MKIKDRFVNSRARNVKMVDVFFYVEWNGDIPGTPQVCLKMGERHEPETRYMEVVMSQDEADELAITLLQKTRDFRRLAARG